MITYFSFQNISLLYNIPYSVIPKEWQLILFSDGSLTRHLEILLKNSIKLQIYKITTAKLVNYHEQFVCSNISYPQKNRQTWLITQNNKKILYATSIWNHSSLSTSFSINIPIGKFLIETELDIFREIYKIDLLYSHDLEKEFNSKGPFWSRNYFLKHNQQILANIQEVFSPRILE